MARSRGYWKKKDSRRQRRILNRSLDVILQVGTHRMAMAMAANLAGRHLIGNRRELTLIERNTEKLLAQDEGSIYDLLDENDEREWNDYLVELEYDMRDQDDYDDALWDNSDMDDRYHYFD